ncbi:VOC family protein [Sphingomonas sp. MG17]|jgi:catechol 2,3-dioxygenase-like lactoylglutathione lyase family enzyme|uniref:VOC family protein n=1 Tax=Sphingomonas tagetis TaxID=2949092 RepID=A0A9X2HSR0_9SPHN|nr:VOC family protein [Sphingomonas tagetis]MCP3732813.1 VOC family protein [Sphingomonas tagetis]
MIKLDHVTIRTRDLSATLRFYEHFLSLRPGWRPPFSIGGAWLYPDGGDYPIVHVIETDEVLAGMRDHIAFRVTGLAAYLDKVKAAGCDYMAIPVPGISLVQVQHRDPNHVLVEATFEDEPIEAADIRDSAVA